MFFLYLPLLGLEGKGFKKVNSYFGFPFPFRNVMASAVGPPLVLDAGTCKHLEMVNRERQYYVYIMQSVSRRVLYIGVTSDLDGRVWEHKNHFREGFSDKYNTTRLVNFERFADIRTVIAREKQLKRWRREKKEWLITRMNPSWRDLSAEWGQPIESVSRS